jgi:tetratricopeptide (TPR) repeat protein
MPVRCDRRFKAALVAALFGLSVSAVPVLAAGDISPPTTPPPSKGSTGTKSTTKKKRHDHQSQEEWQHYIEGYKAARTLVLDGKYEEGLQAFRALGHDDDAEVANYIGYTYRKLGDYDLSKVWYDRALASDPDHVRTWEYYGLWHLEQGNRLKAEEFLQKVNALCGSTTCQEFIDLKAAIDGERNVY